MRKALILPLKRRLEEKTNYKRRLALLKSREPRIVARISNSNVSLQLVNYDGSDKTTLGFLSKNLEKLGWKHSKVNLPASYLSGLVFGYICKKNKVESAVFDMGLARNTVGNKYFAVLKGVADSGLSLPHSEDKVPSKERLSGKHISEEVTKDFEKVKQKIMNDYGK